MSNSKLDLFNSTTKQWQDPILCMYIWLSKSKYKLKLFYFKLRCIFFLSFSKHPKNVLATCTELTTNYLSINTSVESGRYNVQITWTKCETCMFEVQTGLHICWIWWPGQHSRVCDHLTSTSGRSARRTTKHKQTCKCPRDRKTTAIIVRIQSKCI